MREEDRSESFLFPHFYLKFVLGIVTQHDKKHKYIYIAVPPVIIESMTSNDMVVREGTNVSLMCKARGYPEPYVMWRREDGDEMSIAGENGK